MPCRFRSPRNCGQKTRTARIPNSPAPFAKPFPRPPARAPDCRTPSPISPSTSVTDAGSTSIPGQKASPFGALPVLPRSRASRESIGVENRGCLPRFLIRLATRDARYTPWRAKPKQRPGGFGKPQKTDNRHPMCFNRARTQILLRQHRNPQRKRNKLLVRPFLPPGKAILAVEL